MNAIYDGKLFRRDDARITIDTIHRRDQNRVAQWSMLCLAVAEWNGCARSAFPECDPVDWPGHQERLRRAPFEQPRGKLVDFSNDLDPLMLDGCNLVVPESWVHRAQRVDALDVWLRFQLFTPGIERDQP